MGFYLSKYYLSIINQNDIMDLLKLMVRYLKNNWFLLLIIILLATWNIWQQVHKPKVYDFSLDPSRQIDKYSLKGLDNLQLEGLQELQPNVLKNLTETLSAPSVCYDNLNGVKDSLEFIKLEIKYTTPAPTKFKIFTFNMNDEEFKPCISQDKHTMTAYAKINKKDSLLNFNSVVRSSQGNFEYTLSLKAFRVTGAKELIGSFEKTSIITKPYFTNIITDKFKIKSRDEKATSTIAYNSNK